VDGPFATVEPGSIQPGSLSAGRKRWLASPRTHRTPLALYAYIARVPIVDLESATREGGGAV